MGWTTDPEPPDVLMHYSEDANIREFRPHVPRSNPGVPAAVWAIDRARAPLYWFPRDCPRVAVWANTVSEGRRLRDIFSTVAARVQALPEDWREALVDCRLFEYRFEPESFEPWPAAEGQWITHRPVVPFSVTPVGPLLPKHTAAGIDLRFVSDLAAVRAQARECGLPFSIVRFPADHR